MNLKNHWENVYQTKAPDQVSWYQDQPAVSLRLIEAAGIRKDEGIIDVGGGASVLAGCLLEAGYSAVAVLDISAAAIQNAKSRLGDRAAAVEWYEANITKFSPPRRFALWHDRALFHFLTNPEDRKKYVEVLKNAVTPQGHVIIATFAVNGPTKCSGLDVARYDSKSICSELGNEFKLVETVAETHITPWNSEQKFSYFLFKRSDS